MNYVIDAWHVITFVIGAGLAGWIWWTSFRSALVGLGAVGLSAAWLALLVATEWVLAEYRGTLQSLALEAAQNGRFWIAVGIGGAGALCLLASVIERLFGSPPQKPPEPEF